MAGPRGFGHLVVAAAAVAVEEFPRRPLRMGRRKDHPRTLVRPGGSEVIAEAALRAVVYDLGPVLSRAGSRRTRIRRRSHRHHPTAHCLRTDQRIHRTVAAVGETVVAERAQYAQTTGIYHMDRSVARVQADQTYSDPVRPHPAPNPHSVSANHEERLKTLASVDFDCIHLVMSQRPNPLPPGTGA